MASEFTWTWVDRIDGKKLRAKLGGEVPKLQGLGL